MPKEKKKHKKLPKPNQNNNKSDKDWDVEKYRRDFESEEHWSLRKRFMEEHKHNFPEERLVCLAQVFTNIELMGCKYPTETMHLVAELSKNVAAEYRDSRSDRLKRTFITASEAAENRIKDRKLGNSTTHLSCKSNSDKKNNSDQFYEFCGPDKPCFHLKNSSRKSSNLFEGLKFGQFVLYLHGDRNCLRISSQRSNLIYEEKEACLSSSHKQVCIYINNQLITSAAAISMKECKEMAFFNALEILQNHCYSIKANGARSSIQIHKKSSNELVCDVIKDESENKLDRNNKGYKMLEIMGWSGGGLGLQGQGREEPVNYLLNNKRVGLGNNFIFEMDYKYFTQILTNYVESEDIRDIQFDPSFTKEERILIHDISRKLNLKSTSNNLIGERRLVVSKKISNELILHEVLVRKNPIYMHYYHVQVPISKTKLYPQHSVKLQLQ